MGQIEIEECKIPGVKIIRPQIFGDDRGFFMEMYREDTYQEGGIACQFVQDNCVLSRKGVLRGLHFQKEYAQDKLIHVVSGEIYDVAVDLRKESRTYRKWQGEFLSAENRKQLFIPKGFAHGYLVLSETALITYKCSDIYHPEDEAGIIWNDPGIGIEWPVWNEAELILSEKDKKWGRIEE